MPSGDEFSLQRELAQALRSPSGAPLLLINRSGQVTFASPAAEQLLGRGWSDLAHKSAADLFDGGEAAAIQQANRAGTLLANLRTAVLRPDGSRTPVALALSPLEQDGQWMGAVMALRDLSEQQQAEKDLEASERMFRELADALPQIVWITRPDGYHEYYNQHWWSYTGLSYEEAKGAGWNLLLHPDDRERAIERWRHALESGEPYEVEYRFRRASDGQYRWFLGRALPLCDDQGRVVRWFGTCTDIDDQKRAEEELQRAKDLAEGANQAKDQFLATVSHELRTPLSSILGYSQLLKMGLLEPNETTEAIDAIERGAKALAQLVEDILDTSRIINGKLRVQMEPVDMRAVIHDAIEAVRPLANEKSITLAANEGEGESHVRGDSHRLQQAVLNLLTNAVKFSRDGQKVSILLDNVQSALRVRVVDEGAGIKADFLPSLFERFQQADSSSVRRHGGLGLGLSIVKHLIDLHGGTVEAASEGEGRGSTFTILLPVLAIKPAGTDHTFPRKPPGANALSGRRLFVVDDAPAAREIVVSTLRKYGAEVMAVTSVRQALEALPAFGPDLVLSDIAMPGEDGYSLIEQLRAIPGPLGQVPAIALTAFASTEDRSRARSAGFNDHLAKPVEPEKLVDTVARMLEEPVVIPH